MCCNFPIGLNLLDSWGCQLIIGARNLEGGDTRD